jgi:hypothetical protein
MLFGYSFKNKHSKILMLTLLGEESCFIRYYMPSEHLILVRLSLLLISSVDSIQSSVLKPDS